MSICSISDKIEYAFTNKKYDHVCIHYDDYVCVLLRHYILHSRLKGGKLPR